MRRAVVIAGLALLLILGTGQGEARQAGASTRLPHLRMEAAGSANRGPCDARWFVNIKPVLGHDTVVRRVKNLIRCAVRRWSVAGGAEKALEVADCESRFWPWAENGPSKGVFQQNIGPDGQWWRDRARRFLLAWWFPFHWRDVVEHGWFRARANVLLSVRMAHAEGWGAWACA